MALCNAGSFSCNEKSARVYLHVGKDTRCIAERNCLRPFEMSKECILPTISPTPAADPIDTNECHVADEAFDTNSLTISSISVVVTKNFA